MARVEILTVIMDRAAIEAIAQDGGETVKALDEHAAVVVKAADELQLGALEVVLVTEEKVQEGELLVGIVGVELRGLLVEEQGLDGAGLECEEGLLEAACDALRLRTDELEEALQDPDLVGGGLSEEIRAGHGLAEADLAAVGGLLAEADGGEALVEVCRDGDGELGPGEAQAGDVGPRALGVDEHLGCLLGDEAGVVLERVRNGTGRSGRQTDRPCGAS